MIEKERITKVKGKKYLFQNPFYNNCAVVAMYNAFLDDDQSFDIGKIAKE